MTFGKKARRAGWLLILAVFAFGFISAIRPSPASAYGLISTRSIKMSSSQVSTATTGLNVMYNVGFTTATTSTMGAIAIHFCSNDPIIGDACTAPAGFNANVSTTGFNTWTATTGGTSGLTSSSFAINTTTTAPNVIVITKTTPSSVAASTVFNFELGNGTTNGFTNPSALGTFYARITIYGTNTVGAGNIDFSTDANAQTTEKTAYDAGGVAESTATALNVTAKVQEQLTFCMYTGANCAAGGGAVNMGDTNGVLASTSTTYLDATPKFDLASNALGGVNVRLKGDTLTSGTFTITPDGASCTADSTTTTVEQFGIRVVSYGTGQYNGDATAGSTAPDGGVNDFGCTAGNHKFDPTTTNTTYGQPIVKTVGATDVSTTNLELAAKASSTTEAGVYTTTLQFIATATY